MKRSNVEKSVSLQGKIRALARELGALAQEALEPEGLSNGESELLFWVREGLTRPSDIAERMELNPSNLSRWIRTMEDRGYLVRQVDPDNRRQVRLSLTRSGRAAVGRVDPIALELDGAVLEGLSERQLASLRSGIQRIADNVARLREEMGTGADESKS